MKENEIAMEINRTQDCINGYLERISIMEAFKNGATIEYRSYKDHLSTWEITQTPAWNWHEYSYRIKPEPEYVPFDCNDNLIGKEIKAKEGCLRGIITVQDSVLVVMGDIYIPYKKLFEDYVFNDGTPCGKLKN